MSELPDGIEPAPIPEPKESALGIVARRTSDGAYELLFGVRSRRTRFMPGNLAFPGGRFEPGDGSLARCASREVLEETGVAIPHDAWRDAGERTTPPFFTVRFRTRFFVAEVAGVAVLPDPPPAPDEIESLAFHRPQEVLAAWEADRIAVPPPLLPILRAIVEAAPASIDALAAVVAAVNAYEPPHPRIEFVPGIWAFPVRTRTLPPASCTNVWIPGDLRFAVVDPGSDDPEELRALLAVLRRRMGEGAVPHAVVLTHHHRDHVGGAVAVARALGVPVVAHAETIARLPRLPQDVEARAIADGEVIDLGEMTLRALHTPGHAPGHLAFLVPERGALIAGDLVSGLSTILVGFAEGSMDDYLESLARTEALRVRTVLPAHGPPLPPKALAATRAHREAREARVVAALTETARDVAEIASEAYADTPEAPPFLREMQTRAHLVRLAGRGRARADSGGRWSTS